MTSRNDLSEHVRVAFEDAMAMRGRLRDDAFAIQGFSGRKFRVFMNNIVHEVRNARYLEIGVLHGASFCPAIYGNEVTAVAIDNWTQFKGTPEQFYENLEQFRSERANVRVIQDDFRSVDYRDIGSFNIMFYDGSHSAKDQYDGVRIPFHSMDDQYVLIVDDWNWSRVRTSTFNALRDVNARIDFQIEVRTTFAEENLPLVHGATSEWHNGCFVAAVSRNGG